MKFLKQVSLVMLFLIFYYGFTYQVFHKEDTADYPVLRHRLGTILSHSSDKDGVFQGNKGGNFHAYCYYPSDQVNSIRGEYLIRRAIDFKECEGWYGIAFFQEDHWVTEREKIWWSAQQQWNEG